MEGKGLEWSRGLGGQPAELVGVFPSLATIQIPFPAPRRPRSCFAFSLLFSFRAAVHISVHISVHICGEIVDAHGHPVDRRTELLQVHVRADLLRNSGVAVPELSLRIHTSATAGLLAMGGTLDPNQTMASTVVRPGQSQLAPTPQSGLRGFHALLLEPRDSRARRKNLERSGHFLRRTSAGRFPRRVWLMIGNSTTDRPVGLGARGGRS